VEIVVTMPHLGDIIRSLEIALILVGSLLLAVGLYTAGDTDPSISALGYFLGFYSVTFFPFSMIFIIRGISRHILTENTYLLLNFGYYLFKRVLILYLISLLAVIYLLLAHYTLIKHYFLVGIGSGLVVTGICIRLVFLY